MKDLRSKFRSLLALTEFISTVNKGGYPTLHSADDREKKSSQRALNHVLHALADILVRDREVIAVAVSGPNLVLIEGEKEEVTREPDSVDVELADAADRKVLGFAEGDANISEVIDLSRVGITNMSTIVNSDMNDVKVHASSHCMLVGSGQSYLPENLLPMGELSKLYEYFVENLKKKDTLANHISTVEDYLKRHQRVDATQQADHEILLTAYLVTRCWLKMYRRMVTWSSQGYIYYLGTISEDKLKGLLSREIPSDQPEHPDRHNEDLAEMVLYMVRSGLMESAIMKECKGSNCRLTLTNLVATFESRESNSTRLHASMYNAATCVEFHQLLLAALLAYGQGLCALNTAHNESVKVMAKGCQQVGYAGDLLRQIASSLMLRQHLSMCEGLLNIPSNDAKHLLEYQGYTHFPHDGCLNPPGDDAENAVETSSEALGNVYLTWIRLQVSHWLGVGTISRAFSASAAAASAVPSISLIAVRYPNGPRELEPWEDTVKDLFRTTPPALYSVEEVVDVVIRIANQPETPGQHHVFKKWKGIVNGKNTTAESAIHCEAALASLAKWSHSLPLTDNIDLKELLQNTDQSMIAVSRRCCPACWKLLGIMDPIDRFGVRGCHPTVHEVELPPWLPSGVIKGMVDEFEVVLRDEIFTMMLDKVKRRKARRPSDHYFCREHR